MTPTPDLPAGAGGQDAAGAERDESADRATRLAERERVDVDLARRLRAAMDGDTPACAAVKLGVSQHAVARAFRSGRASASMLQGVCRVYGVDGHWLLTGRGERRRIPASPRSGAGLGSEPPSSASEQLLVEVSTRLASLLAELEHYRSRAGPP
jgi:hypothetical protein